MDSFLYISVVPIILLLMYIYKKDKNKESFKLLKKIFIWGLICFIPILIFEGVFTYFFDIYDKSNYIKLFFTTFFGIGLIEEFFKWIVVYKIAYNSKEFDEVYDGIVYSVCSSLGFACIENILYIFGGGLGTGVLRAFTAVPVHTCDGVVMGYYYGLAKKASAKGDKKKNYYLFMSLFMPVIAHTLYDYLLLCENIRLIFWWFVLYVFFVIVCFQLVKRVAMRGEIIYEKEPIREYKIMDNIFFHIDDQYKYCSNCGSPCTTNYCSNCGYKNKKD